jgi:hypothetical protein
VTSSYKHSTEPTTSVKDGEFLEWVCVLLSSQTELVLVYYYVIMYIHVLCNSGLQIFSFATILNRVLFETNKQETVCILTDTFYFGVLE